MEVHIVSSNEILTPANGSAVLTVARSLTGEAAAMGRDAVILGAVGREVTLACGLPDSYVDQAASTFRYFDAARTLLGLPARGSFRLRTHKVVGATVVYAHNRPWDGRALRTTFPVAHIALYVHNRVLTRLPRRVVRRALAEFDSVICVSDFIRHDLARRAGVAQPPENWVTALSGVSTPDGDGSTPERDIDVLFVGRLTPEKGVDILLDALSEIRQDLTVAVVGGKGFIPGAPPQKYELSLRRSASRLRHSVRFYGPLAPSDVWELRRRAKVTVIPSRWAEPLGLTVLEAQASGSATIATDVGGIPEVAPAGCAVLVSKPNPRMLAVTMSELLRDECRRLELAEKGQAFAATTTWRKTYGQVLSAVE